MEQNNLKRNMENNVVEAEGEEASEEKAKREKVDCSHRVIEKRRRDRINNSLLQLSKLVPIEKFNKKNSGKLEKAEILEVTVHYLTQQQFKKEDEPSTQTANGTNQENHQASENPQQNELSVFLRGFEQCISDATKFFQDIEELDVSEGRCYRLIQHLKRQISRYETKERDLSNVGIEEQVVWDTEETRDVPNRRMSSDSNQAKRKNGGDLDGTPCKKPCPSSESNNKPEQPSNTEQECSTDSSPTNSNSETSSNIDPSRNFMPFVFPNMPLFTTLPFAGANNMPRFQTSPTQHPGYQYQQSPQYIPVALPQFPVMGMNFMPGFGMVNGEQNQNGSMATTVPNSLPMQSGVPNQTIPNLMPTGIPNGFFPSMYTNGLHANIMSMRPSDSGYESSEKSSLQSFSDDSCQSYAA